MYKFQNADNIIEILEGIINRFGKWEKSKDKGSDDFMEPDCSGLVRSVQAKQ